MTAEFGTSPVIPVVVVDQASNAVPLARALLAGGIDAIEITLRTSAALDAVRAITEQVDGIRVGTGTVLSPADAVRAAAAGSSFLVTPATTSTLLDSLQDVGLPYLPGVATPSEMLTLIDRGIGMAKLFPAEAAGGVALLQAVAGPMPRLRFCPTGGITASNAEAYLAQPNVMQVGGSWIAPRALIAAAQWGRIQALARHAAKLGHRQTEMAQLPGLPA